MIIAICENVLLLGIFSGAARQKASSKFRIKPWWSL
jgi:hypothetical protein